MSNLCAQLDKPQDHWTYGVSVPQRTTSCVTERNNDNTNNNNNNNNYNNFLHLLMNISRIIPMKLHYNRIKIIFLTFIVTMSTVAFLKIPNPECTTTHAKIILVKIHFYKIKQNIFIFHNYHGNGSHFQNAKP